MATKKKLLEAAAGAAGGEALNVEEVFSTYIYNGDASNPTTVTNGIDLAGEGGMVWIKRRDGIAYHRLFDSERSSFTTPLATNTTDAQAGFGITSVSSDGFTLGAGYTGVNDDASYNFTSWTFRKAPKFFDVVTYTGNGVAGRTVSHNLGTTVGALIIKRTDTTGEWIVYHKDISSINNVLFLNSTSGELAYSSFNSTAPSSTEFTLGTRADVNASGGTYVAYLFAHNNGDGDFGSTADQDIIKCGSYNGNGSADGPEINLGFEPQWVLIKNTTQAANWRLVDVMRGFDYNDARSLYPNLNAAEGNFTVPVVVPTPTGFKLVYAGLTDFNTNGNTYIYIAIRRGPMAVPESATDVFAIDEMDNSPTAPPTLYSGFPVDMAFYTNKSATSNRHISSRMIGNKLLQTNQTNAEIDHTYAEWDFMDGWFSYAGALSNYYSWMWKRAPSFFDVVAYTGNGTARTVSHNLGVAPEMMWIKDRDNVRDWYVLNPNNRLQLLNDTRDEFDESFTAVFFGSDGTNVTAPTASDFTLYTATGVNASGANYIAYLFASLDGVSKVFSVTKSSGSDASVDCGFTSGPRFVMLKRTDSTGDWYVWDSERGIVAGNDPYLLLNSTAAEVTSTDYIDPTSNGFTIVNGGLADGDYIGYAVA